MFLNNLIKAIIFKIVSTDKKVTQDREHVFPSP